MRVPRLGASIATAMLVGLLAPGPASAHLRTGTVAVGYEARVSVPRPSSSGPFAVGVYASDLALHLTVHASHTVVVLGYLGEPFLRIGPAGVAISTASPTAAAAGLLGKGGHAVSGQGWRLTHGDTAAWHDARVSRLRPGARSAEWRVPILVDGHPSAIVGRTWRLPRPLLWPWLAILAAFAGIAIALGLTARPAPLATYSRPLGALAGAAAVLTEAGFVLDPYASAGTWILALDETAFILAAGAASVWAPGRWRTAGGIGLGLLGLAVGLSKLPVFLNADVLSALPANLTRLLAATSIGAGLAGAALAGLWLVREEATTTNVGDTVPLP